ncbi:MAG: phenylacetate--CoA ligase [Desulfovibrio sp.]|nr:phenylacetate--CoA ligase [Desulfovibrio sp.]MCA1984884.1 phenylacetate--CoA ligase [Desulfovibrio sp.]
MAANRRFLPEVTAQSLYDMQTSGLQWTLAHAWQGSPLYRARLQEAGWQPGERLGLEELGRLPFTTVEDLRQGYPLPLLSVPEEQVVRVHASSGTTGKRKVLAYTEQDILTWKHMFARCYELAGLTVLDRVQICVGYGLWTAGAGFQLGCEHFGAMAVPVGPGNLEMQLTLLEDFRSTCLCSTASMALLLGEAVEKQGLRERIALKKCIFGAEAHSPAMRKAFEEKLGLEESFDIAGLTELYGPGTGLECQAHAGLHYWADLFILEILDPTTLTPVAPGEVGEMVVTTLRKEAAPLIRYRTRDLTRLLPGDCPCGCTLPRHDRILGRSDDMIIYRGVNIYPGQIAEVLGKFADCSSEYRIVLERSMGKDVMRVEVERSRCATADADQALAARVAESLHKALLARVQVRLVDPGSLPRSFGKSRRVVDERGE